MLKTEEMKLPKGLSDDEVRAVLTGDKGETRLENFRLSAEAQNILAAEQEFYGLDRTKTLELILREHRELVQRKRRKK